MKNVEEMNGTELVAEYNAKSGKLPIKRFETLGAGRKRVAALRALSSVPEPKKTATVTKKTVAVANGIAAEFGVRPTSNRAKLLAKLENGSAKQFELIKLLYASSDPKWRGALSQVLKGISVTIDKKKLPYVLKREKNDKKEISYVLQSK